MTALNKLISPEFFEDINGIVEIGAVALNACVVVEYIDSDGKHQLAAGFSDDMTFYQKEGMCRSLLRDAIALPCEFERREAARLADEIDDDG